MRNLKKILLLIIIFITVISMNSFVQGKYIFEYTSTVAKIDIDRNPPKIELISISNTNTGYEKYANKTHTITVKVKVIEKNIKENLFNKNTIIANIENIRVNPEQVEIKEVEKTSDTIVYDIILKQLNGNGDLVIKIPEGTIVDKSFNVNQEKIINTNIIIDNIAPSANFQEKVITDGKVEANINLSEQIRPVEGWNLSNLTLKKVFTNNVIYELKVIDFAQNETKVQINISKATNVELIFASHNSEIGWTFGHTNYDIAGKEAILRKHPDYKTEALAFRLKGNIDKDFVRVRAFVYSHWGQGSKAVCGDSGMIYSYGQNPSTTTWKTMNSTDLVTLNGEKYFQFGGSKINIYNRTDINGKNPIPEEVANRHPYGISAITMSLKDYSYYSILYQILVDKVGWLEPCSDGQETKYSYDKPMTAIRVTLVPKTEKKYILEKWKQDVGTFNVNN